MTLLAMTDGDSVYGLRGYSAVTWSIGDEIEIMPDVDIGISGPSVNQFEDPQSEITAPDGVDFSAPASASDALSLGNLAPGGIHGVWRREWIMQDHQSRSGAIGDTIYSWS